MLAGEVIDGLASTQSHLNRMLRRHIGAEASTGQELQALDEATSILLRSGNDHPASTVTGHTIRPL